MFLFLEQLKSKKYDAALVRLDEIGDAGVYGLFQPLFQSWVLLAQGKEAEAEARMQKLLEKENFKDFKQFHAGLFYDLLGKTQLAEKMYSEALVIPSTMSLRTIEAYGILLQRLGLEADARQLYVNYLEKAPDNARLQYALRQLDKKKRVTSVISSEEDGISEIFYTAANFLMQDNVRLPAIIYLRYAEYLRQDFYITDYLLAQVFEADKYYDGALESYGRIPSRHALYQRARLQMAWVYEKMGDVDKTIEAMKKLSREFPKNEEVNGALGDVLRMNSRFEEAAQAYSKYLDGVETLEERHWSIFYTRGISYEQAKQWKRAEADFLKALELRPDQPQVLNYLAYSWIDKGLNFDEARKMLERAVELRPNDGYIIDSLGWALFKIGDTSKAVEYLERAVLLQTNDWAINDHLGDAYWAIGRNNEAKFQWRHALSLNPDEKPAQKIRAKIRDEN
jgi:tetratricopeptide (TPR) repeat protein